MKKKQVIEIIRTELENEVLDEEVTWEHLEYRLARIQTLRWVLGLLRGDDE